jgi:UDP-glucose 4-epimerase
LKNPLLYYINNISSTTILLSIMKKYNCKNMIFSSSCTIYGKQISPVNELSIVNMNNILSPYGKTKYIIEEMLKDIYNSDNNWNIVILRYFNPVGCHSTGLIGENLNGIPNNLFPYLLKVASGEYKELNIYGYDYSTPDGTCVRDFIHVVDLAIGHVKSLNIINTMCGLKIYNLGSGKGTSVMEFVNTFNKVNNVNIKYKLCEKREGDIDIVFADPTKANIELEWKADKTIKDVCKDGFNYLKKMKSLIID